VEYGDREMNSDTLERRERERGRRPKKCHSEEVEGTNVFTFHSPCGI